MNLFYVRRETGNIMIVNLDLIKYLLKESGHYFIFFENFGKEITKDEFEKLEYNLKKNGGLK